SRPGLQASSINRSHSFAVREKPYMPQSAQLETPQEAVKQSAINNDPSTKPDIGRIVSLDVLRGLVMVLMLNEATQLPKVAASFPHSWFWNAAAFSTEHVPWQGCSLHDLIQPAFSFLVGAALPFSIASRKKKGQTFGHMLRHTIWRAFLLIFL